MENGTQDGQGRQNQMQNDIKHLDDLITEILTFTELGIVDDSEMLISTNHSRELAFGAKGRKRQHQFPLSYIGPVRPLIFDVPEIQNHLGVFMDAVPSDVDGKWDISLIQRPREDWGPDATFQLTRTRRVLPKEVRGQKIYSEYIAEHSMAVIKRDKTYVSARINAFFLGRDTRGFGRWASEQWDSCFLYADSDNGDIVTQHRKLDEDPETTNALNAAIGLQFTRDYEWTVTLSLANIGNPVVFATDPVGVREVFAARDKLGMSRREALKHWVKEHWRRSRSDPEVEIMVRQYLRGIEPFVWKGLNCKLAPSPFDIRLVERMDKERKEKKREGKTMRLRQDNASVV